MKQIIKKFLSRRDWLRHSAAATLALGLWPGCAAHRENGRGGNFSFIAINDTHYFSPECPAFFQRVIASVKALTPRPEFCLMIGDLAEKGTLQELGAMRDVLRSFDMPFHPVIGNHDYLSQTDRSTWDQLFPGKLNYHFEHRDWQLIGLDSTEGLKYRDTYIQPETFRWLDDQLRKLNPAKPTILFTHFPLGMDLRYRPKNADALLERFGDFNLVAVFNGHFHGATERQVGNTILTTNKCCSIARNNHDGTREKGYFLCHAIEGRIHRQFIEV